MSTDRQLVSGDELRVLVLAPVGRDAALICELLLLSSIQAIACSDMHELSRALHGPTGAVVLTEESMAPTATAELLAALRPQPPWSDLPVIALIGREPLASGAADALHALLSAANVSVLERPLLGLSLTSAVDSALRARRKQYEQRDMIASERAARAQAEAALRTRDEFLATVSHELRTPLSAIVLWTQLLERERSDSPATAEGLPALTRSADALSKLIEDLLDMSRAISGTLQISPRPVEVAEIARAAIEVVRPLAQAKDIALRVDLRDDGMVRADPDRLQQVFWNVLSNAIKFTPRGGRVSIHSTHDEHRARVEVTDTGKGIAPQFLPHVFEHFRQAETTTRRLEGGLGLGLAIGRQLLELHGGTIRADSPGEGRGAVFTIELPLLTGASTGNAQKAPHAGEHGAAASLAGLRVLLVEDDRDTRQAIGKTLEQHGACVLLADTGHRVLELLAAATAEDQPPDTLLIDLGLPEMNGYDLLDTIAALQRARGAPVPPAGLITGYVNAHERERARAAGFQAFVPKPITTAQLIAVVEELAGAQRGRR